MNTTHWIATHWIWIVEAVVFIVGVVILWHKPKARSRFGITLAVIATVLYLVYLVYPAVQAKLIPWLTT